MAPMTQMMMARAAGKHMARLMGYACANPDGADPWPGHRWCHSATRLSSWLFLVNLPVGVLAIVLAVLLANDREETRSRELSIFLASPCSLRDSCSSCTDRIIWASAPGLTTLLISIVLLALAFFRMAIRKGAQGAHRSSAIQEKNLCVRHHAVHVERNLVRGPNAGSDLSHPRLWPITECDRLVAGSAWSGDDLFLSMDRSPDAAVRDTKGIG